MQFRKDLQLREVAARPPNAHLLSEIRDLQPGRALDAGCRHGSEAIWLAASGWQVTAVDFSMTALEHGRSTAQTVGPDVAQRITWVEGDLGSWAPSGGSTSSAVCTSTWPGRWARWSIGSVRASLPAEPCSWSATCPWIP